MTHKAFLLVAATLVCLWVPSGVLGQPEASKGLSAESVCEDLRKASAQDADPTLIEHSGIQGMFFPLATSKLLLCEIRELRIRRDEVSIGAEQLALRLDQIGFLTTQRDLAVESRNDLLAIVDDSDRRRRDAEERLDHWSRSPILWMVVGSVVTVATFAAAVAAVD